MKRDNRGNMIPMVGKWSQPPLSCLACRQKKRRCDRKKPCSNCVQRHISCEYSGGAVPTAAVDSDISHRSTYHANNNAKERAAQSAIASHNSDELAYRIRRLEEFSFKRRDTAQEPFDAYQHAVSIRSAKNITVGSPYVTPFGAHFLSISSVEERGMGIYEITRLLPPLHQARELFSHFAATVQPTFGVLHIPTARDIMENTYRCLLEGEEPNASALLLVFGIFAGSALIWTPQLLQKLATTKSESKAAFMAYARTALAIIDHPDHIAQPSTTALVGMGVLGHLFMNTDGFPIKVHLIRHRCLLMSRDMQIHRLDTPKSREERRIKGCNMIDVEIQRRAWWYMVASDWLLSFSGGPHEGAYTFQPKHMDVNLPSNTDDEFITPSGIEQEFSLNVPTGMSAFHARVQRSELCREVIDALPSILLESQDTDYETILDLDAKYQKHMDNLPFFFKLDQDSIEQSRRICKERPYIAWQRIFLHFSLHTRLCRLHREFHLEGITNPKYAYSHKTCIQSAQKVLELRRQMDEISVGVGLNPGRFWTVMHHVFFAAFILAMDVSFNPNAPDAEARKTRVIAAYQTLEKSKQDSNNLLEGVQKNLQILMSTLNKDRSQKSLGPISTIRDPGTTQDDSSNEPGLASSEPDEISTAHSSRRETTVQPPSVAATDRGLDISLMNDMDQEGWEQLWSDFVAVAPELDVPQWSSLLEDVDFSPQLDAYLDQ